MLYVETIRVTKGVMLSNFPQLMNQRQIKAELMYRIEGHRLPRNEASPDTTEAFVHDRMLRVTCR